MTFDTFINTWTGKPVDFDGVYPNQCMDLAHQYAYDVLGITDKAVLAKAWAALVYTQFAWGNLFDRIANTPNGVPQKGDIVIFAESVNYDSNLGHGYGHICVYIDGDVNSFRSFDANWPTGSLPHIQTHSYNGVLGWLHPKAPAPTTDYQQLYTAEQAKTRDLTAQLSTVNGKLDQIRKVLA